MSRRHVMTLTRNTGLVVFPSISDSSELIPSPPNPFITWDNHSQIRNCSSCPSLALISTIFVTIVNRFENFCKKSCQWWKVYQSLRTDRPSTRSSPNLRASSLLCFYQTCFHVFNGFNDAIVAKLPLSGVPNLLKTSKAIDNQLLEIIMGPHREFPNLPSSSSRQAVQQEPQK